MLSDINYSGNETPQNVSTNINASIKLPSFQMHIDSHSTEILKGPGSMNNQDRVIIKYICC